MTVCYLRISSTLEGMAIVREKGKLRGCSQNSLINKKIAVPGACKRRI